MIVCIASKGRPNTKTHELFEQCGYEVVHFVEPQERDLYNKKNVVTIHENDRGLAYVRNFIIEYCKANGHKWAWVVDDDITGFGYAKDGKTIKKDAGILRGIEMNAKRLPFEVVGINYQQHAWRETREYSVNKNYADCCVLMNMSAITWRFDETTKLKVDRDFCAQAIVNGYGVLRFNRVWFACPNVGTNKGGLHDLYAAKKDEESARKMIVKWAPYASLVQKGDRLDVKIDLKAIAAAYGKEVR